MSPQPNKQQQAAIEAGGSNIIVSAGAGSGKTMVLTARVIRLLEQGTPLNQLLVLTFTNAAAQEMKQRIRARLLALHRYDEAASIDGSRIMTFDAFALSLVTKYHYVLGLEPQVGVIDEQVLALIRKRTIADMFETRYRTREPGFVKLISSYAVRDDGVLQSFVASIDKMADLKIDKIGYLNTYLETFFSDEYIQEALNKYEAMFDHELSGLIDSCSGFLDSEMANIVRKELTSLHEAGSLSQKMSAILSFKFQRKISGLLDEDKALHDAIKNQFKPLKTWSSVGNIEQIKVRYLETFDAVKTLIDLALELENRMAAFKKNHQKFSFSDIAKLAIKLAENELINRELKSEIRHIMIDEYQDTNDIQDYFMNLLSDNNAFMVGDIKQSIYRFRNANCALFASKYEAYGHRQGGEKIDMNTNFRSRNEVLGSINRLFSQLMSLDIGGADYLASHFIEYGNKQAYDQNKDDHSDIGMRVYGYLPQNNLAPALTEINLIAQDIEARITAGHKILKADKMVPVQYEDFAILIDRRASFADFKRIFHDYGIPLDVTINEDFHSDDVLNVFKNLIKLVNGARRDDFPQAYIHELMSVWRSFLFEYEDSQIYQRIMDLTKYEDDPLLEHTRTLALQAASLSLGELLTRIAFTFEMHHKIIRLGDVVMHQAKIEQLINFATSLEDLGYTLEQFVAYFDDVQLFDETPTFEIPHSSGPAVKLLTIHKSKGLEFPIVYFPGLSKQFNRTESKTSFIASATYGLILPIIDDKNAYTMFHYLARRVEDEQSLSEEVRKFYVGLTRSKELIILIHQLQDDKPLLSLQKANSFRDFIRFAKLYEHEGVIKENHKIANRNRRQQHVSIPISFKKINLSNEKITPTSASKSMTHTTDEALKFGIELHEIFSHLDYKNPNLGYIDDEVLRSKVIGALSLSPFEGATFARVYQEYSYYNQLDGSSGTIDLMLEFDDEIRIIDLKSGTLEDSDYDRQLRTYARYINTVSRKPLKLYLVSLTRTIFRKVAIED